MCFIEINILPSVSINKLSLFEVVLAFLIIVENLELGLSKL